MARQEEIKLTISDIKPILICLQETKLSVITPVLIRSLLGSNFENNFDYLPATDTRGGVLIVAMDSTFVLTNYDTTQNTLTVKVTDLRCITSWLEKKMFIRELRRLKHLVVPQWLIIGDFNLIYKSQDKNNCRLKRSLMNRFRCALNYLEVREANLVGKKYTWTNHQNPPTMTRIDRAFLIPALEDGYGNLTMQAVSSSISDHCPIILLPLHTPPCQPIFRFESHWPSMPGFQDCVAQTWAKVVPNNQNGMGVLHIKLNRVAKALKKWSKSLIPHNKLVMGAYKEIIFQLERVQEFRLVTIDE
jgi:hypothetical protein